MKISNPFQTFFQKNEQPPEKPKDKKNLETHFSGQLWINYKKEINLFEPTDYKNVNLAIKVAVYVVTITFVIIATQLTLIIDAVRYLYKVIYISHKDEQDSSPISFITKLSMGSIGVSVLFAGAYLLRSYKII